MKVEMVFTGLCAFLNVKGENESMPDPSVILVRTDHHAPSPPPPAPAKRRTSGLDLRAPKKTKGSGKHRDPSPDSKRKGLTSEPEHQHDAGHDAPMEHVAFIAFDTLTTKLTTAPAVEPEVVQHAVNFRFLRLDGVQIEIENDTPGIPNLPDDTYRTLVVRKDDYWLEVKDQWDTRFVNKGGVPDKSEVIAYLRFGSGDITAGRVCQVPWTFTRHDGTVLEGNFAEEVVYSNFPHTDNDIVIRLRDLASPATVIQTLRFSPLPENQHGVTLFIGNNTMDDMALATDRNARPAIAKPNDHFKFLNAIADPTKAAQFPGPIPAVPEPVANAGGPLGNGGNLGGGPCGPVNGNGAP